VIILDVHASLMSQFDGDYWVV